MGTLPLQVFLDKHISWMSLGQLICLILKLQLHAFWKICFPSSSLCPLLFLHYLSPLHIFLGQICLSMSPRAVITLLFFSRGGKIKKKHAHTASRSKGFMVQGQNPMWNSSLLTEQVTKTCPPLSLLDSVGNLEFQCKHWHNLLGCEPAA